MLLVLVGLTLHPVRSFSCDECHQNGYEQDACNCGVCGSFGGCSFSCTPEPTEPRVACDAVDYECSNAPSACDECGKWLSCLGKRYSLNCFLMPAICRYATCLPFRTCLVPPFPPSPPPLPPLPPLPPSPPPSPPQDPILPCTSCMTLGFDADLCNCGACGSKAPCEASSCDVSEPSVPACLTTAVECTAEPAECHVCHDFRDCLHGLTSPRSCDEMPKQCQLECLSFRTCPSAPPSAPPTPTSPPSPPSAHDDVDGFEPLAIAMTVTTCVLLGLAGGAAIASCARSRRYRCLPIQLPYPFDLVFGAPHGQRRRETSLSTNLRAQNDGLLGAEAPLEIGGDRGGIGGARAEGVAERELRPTPRPPTDGIHPPAAGEIGGDPPAADHASLNPPPFIPPGLAAGLGLTSTGDEPSAAMLSRLYPFGLPGSPAGVAGVAGGLPGSPARGGSPASSSLQPPASSLEPRPSSGASATVGLPSSATIGLAIGPPLGSTDPTAAMEAMAGTHVEPLDLGEEDPHLPRAPAISPTRSLEVEEEAHRQADPQARATETALEIAIAHTVRYYGVHGGEQKGEAAATEGASSRDLEAPARGGAVLSTSTRAVPPPQHAATAPLHPQPSATAVAALASADVSATSIN